MNIYYTPYINTIYIYNFQLKQILNNTLYIWLLRMNKNKLMNRYLKHFDVHGLNTILGLW